MRLSSGGSGAAASLINPDVTGTVRDSASGQPIQGADVVLLRGQAIVVSATTDPFGRFSLHDVAPGTYDVGAAGRGHAHREPGLRAERVSGLADEHDVANPAAGHRRRRARAHGRGAHRREPVVLDTATQRAVNFHNHGEDLFGFGKLQYVASGRDVLRLDVNASPTRFDVSVDSAQG